MKSKSFLIIAIIYFLVCIGNNLIHPITTPFIQNYLQIDSVYFGIYFSLMSLGQVFGAILCGILSKKIKIKYLLIGGIIGYAVFQLMFGFINFDPNIVIAWRFLAGLFISFPNTLILVFGLNYLSSEERIKGLSILASVNILGVACGYEIAGLLHDYVFFDNYHLSFITQACWCLFTAIFTFIFLKNIEKENNEKSTNYLTVIKNMKPSKVVFFIVFLLCSLATIIVSKYFEPYFQNIDNQRFSPSDLAHIVTLTSVIGIIANLTLIPLIKKSKKLNTSIIFTIFLLVSGLLVLTIFTQKNEDVLVIMIFSLYLIYSMIRYLIVPVEQNIAVDNIDNSEVSSYISLRQAILSSAQVIGPLLMSSVFAYNMSYPFIISGILFFIAGLIMLFLIKVKKNNKKN